MIHIPPRYRQILLYAQMKSHGCYSGAPLYSNYSVLWPFFTNPLQSATKYNTVLTKNKLLLSEYYAMATQFLADSPVTFFGFLWVCMSGPKEDLAQGGCFPYWFEHGIIFFYLTPAHRLCIRKINFLFAPLEKTLDE